MFLKIISSVLEISTSSNSWAEAIFNGVVITASYNLFMCGLQLFVYELDRMLFLMESNDEKEF
jgi:hypothetical protein